MLPRRKYCFINFSKFQHFVYFFLVFARFLQFMSLPRIRTMSKVSRANFASIILAIRQNPLSILDMIGRKATDSWTFFLLKANFFALLRFNTIFQVVFQHKLDSFDIAIYVGLRSLVSVSHGKGNRATARRGPGTSLSR